MLKNLHSIWYRTAGFIIFAVFLNTISVFAIPETILQQQTINGVVTDADTGVLLTGVTVMVKDSQEMTGNVIGTLTDVNGNYTINVPDGLNTLVFSYIGYVRLEVAIDGRQAVNVQLQQDISMLEEAVVVGFGTQRRVNLSGSVDQINMRQLEARSISNVTQGLQGLVPNLNVDYTEGAPGSEPRINIRGFTSINGGEPLIIIDGVPAEKRDLNRLDPMDVASISVLKDASSAAIYGARAAFGVLLIETNRGTRSGININLSSRASWDTPTILPDKVTDPYTYMRWQDMSTSATPWNYINFSDEMYEWARQRSDNPESTPAVRENPNNPGQWQYMGDRNWTEYFLSDYGLSSNNTLSIDGMTDRTRFYLSGSFDDQIGALQLAEDAFERTSIRTNVEYDTYDWLTIGNRTNITRSQRNTPTAYESGTWSMWQFYDLEPMGWDKNPDGTWGNNQVGILGARLTQGGESTDEYQNYQTTFTARTTILPQILTVNADFTLRSEFRDWNWDQKKYQVGYGPNDIREFGDTRVWRNRTTYDYQVLNIYSNLNLDFNQHEISSILGFNQEKSEIYQLISDRSNVISSSLPSLSLALGDPQLSDMYRAWAVRGIFGRMNYVFDNRYIVEFNGRYDGSSRFPTDNQWGFFPSASMAWRIDQEKFMERFDWMDMLKLRASYGTLGNQSVAEFGHIPSMTASASNYLIGNVRPLQISSPPLVSSNYSWEEVSTRNIGLDMDLLGSRLTTSFDVYVRDTKGMLTLGRELPAVLGTNEPNENAADLETKGWEMALHYRDTFNFFDENFFFGARFTLADSRSYITKFDNPEGFLNQYYVGQEIGEIWGLRYLGMFQNADEIANHADQSNIVPWGALDIVPGWPKFEDLNEDGKIQTGNTVDDPGDLTVIGNSQARFRFGVNLDFSYKNFDMRAFFQGVGKRDFFPQHYLFWGFYQQPYSGGYRHLMDYYRPTDDSQEMMDRHSQAYIDAGMANANLDARFPVLQAWQRDVNTSGLGNIPDDNYMMDASYVRLKNFTIGYSLPRSILQAYGIQNVRIYASGENLAEWSSISDIIDPEAITDDGFGYRYPFQRRYSLGINVSF
ncbi:MAG TPA: TonB-dependent receptor [Bacteroidetes bacterium]|nr:TonB-dependent receptor [Bacteroidota bacterium]